MIGYMSKAHPPSSLVLILTCASVSPIFLRAACPAAPLGTMTLTRAVSVARLTEACSTRPGNQPGLNLFKPSTCPHCPPVQISCRMHASRHSCDWNNSTGGNANHLAWLHEDTAVWRTMVLNNPWLQYAASHLNYILLSLQDLLHVPNTATALHA
jgi:hypothetical protein